MKRYFLMRLHKKNQARLRHLVDHAFACSAEAGAWLFGPDYARTHRIHIIKNAVDAAAFCVDDTVRAQYRRLLALEQSLVIIHIGRFSLAKNQSFLLDIFHDLENRKLNYRLVFVGDGEMKPGVVQKAVKYKFDEKVQFLGHRDDIPQLLQAAEGWCRDQGLREIRLHCTVENVAGNLAWQALGYAEADPTFDIEGVDAAHKATIMSAIAFGVPVQFDKAYVEGISKLDATDIKYAEQLGYRIKLLGIARRRTQGIELRVHPTLIPEKRLIANVEGAMNAVLVHGDAVGATLYYGKGAGAEPTASAVIADLVDVTRLHTADPEHRVPHLAFQPDQITDVPVLPIDDVETSYYLRLRVVDKPGVLADVTRILADQEISIDAMLQREPEEGESQTDIIILTHLTVEKNADTAIARIEALDSVNGKVTRLRLENL